MTTNNCPNAKSHLRANSVEQQAREHFAAVGLESEFAERVGRQVEVMVERLHFPQAAAVIKAAERQYRKAVAATLVRGTDEVLDRPLAELGLRERTLNLLEADGRFLVRDLMACTREYLLSLPNCGPTVVLEIESALRKVVS